jgi:hypothetical protein
MNKVFVSFIGFVIVIIELKVRVDVFASCMEYKVFGFADIDGHFVGTKQTGYFLISVLT